MAAELLPQHRRMREALEHVRGRARERARHVDDWMRVSFLSSASEVGLMWLRRASAASGIEAAREVAAERSVSAAFCHRSDLNTRQMLWSGEPQIS